MGHGLEAPPLDRLHHGCEGVLACLSPLQKAAGALGKERGGNGAGSNHAPGCQEGGIARLEVDYAVLAFEDSQAGRLAIVGEPDDLHG